MEELLMNRIESVKQARKELKAIHSGCAGDTIFMAKMSLLSVELLDFYIKKSMYALNQILSAVQKKSAKKVHKPTRWQTFMAKGLRSNKTMRQIAQEWKSLKD
jgi:hypothetical protein